MTRTISRRNGTILPLVAVSLVALVGLVAMAVDIGLLTVARTSENAADLGTASPATGYSMATLAIPATLITSTMPFQRHKICADDNQVLTQTLTSSQIQVRSGIYTYDSTAQRFNASYPSSPGTNAWSVMEVTISGNAPTYFGRVFNINSFAVKTQAVAAHRPRDVALILDFSGSMKFGTESGFYTSGSGSIRGSLNGDPSIPKFGPWYAMSQHHSKRQLPTQLATVPATTPCNGRFSTKIQAGKRTPRII